MFNRKASSSESRPDRIMETLALEPGQKVADIGSGGGYFSLRFAEAVGKEGKVYAVDVNPKFLEFIEKNAKERGLDNIETVPAEEKYLSMPDNSLDRILARNVYHHLPDRAEYFMGLKNSLKPGGEVVIVEHKGTGFFNFRRLFGHHTPKETIIEELEEAGYRLMDDHDVLPKQFFLVFSRKGG